MWTYEKRLQYPISIKNTNPALAKIIIAQYGGPDGELAASLRYLSQRYSMPYPELKAILTDIGTEELAHLEMVGTIVHQLTRNLTIEQIKAGGYDAYFVNHTNGVYPADSGGSPFTAAYLQVKGDPITDIHEDLAAEQKARSTYDNILRFADDPDVRDPIKFLRQREVVHYQRFGEGLRIVTDQLDSKNFYAFNPAFDKVMNSGVMGASRNKMMNGNVAGKSGNVAGMSGNMGGNVAGMSGNMGGNVAGMSGNMGGNVAGMSGNMGGNVAGMSGNMGGNVAGMSGNMGGNVAGMSGNMYGNVAGMSGNMGGNVAGMSGNMGGNVAGMSGNMGGNVAGMSGNMGGNVAGMSGNMYGNVAGMGSKTPNMGGVAGMSEKMPGMGGVAGMSGKMPGMGGVAGMSEKMPGMGGVAGMSEKMPGMGGVAGMSGNAAGMGRNLFAEKK